MERKLLALWEAIRLATETGELAAAADQAVRLVRPPGGVSGVRRYSPAVSAARSGLPGIGDRATQGRMGPD